MAGAQDGAVEGEDALADEEVGEGRGGFLGGEEGGARAWGGACCGVGTEEGAEGGAHGRFGVGWSLGGRVERRVRAIVLDMCGSVVHYYRVEFRMEAFDWINY